LSRFVEVAFWWREPVIGTTVSHYRVLSQLGSGGMGVVYLAEDLLLKRKVALKFLKASGSAHQEARLLREAQAASTLDHPNIGTIYEIGDWNGQRFIAMAYLPGETLQARLRRGPVALPEIVDVAGQVASGLAAAHAVQIRLVERVSRVLFDELANDAITDYEVEGKRSADDFKRRIDLHLRPYFRGRRAVSLTTATVREYCASRQADMIVKRKARRERLKGGTYVDHPEVLRHVSSAQINRELAALKRIFNLARQSGKVLHVPYIPMLREDNVRKGFFEPEQYHAVLNHLPAPLKPIVTFAYITGWRIASEVLPLEWRQVDFDAGEVRLDAGTTKNDEGRVFPLTRDLRALLKAQETRTEALTSKGFIVPWVFYRMVAKGRGGKKRPLPIRGFTKAFKAACRAAGCPDRIPHDLRRTAVRSLVEAGIAERVAMTMTGHKTRSVFERYNIVSGDDLKVAARKLDALTELPRKRRASGGHRPPRPSGHFRAYQRSERPIRQTQSTKSGGSFGGAARI
jgi:integrase